MKRTAALWGAALWVCLLDGRAGADELVAYGGTIFESAHSIRIRVAGNLAFLEVERTFDNKGDLDDEVTLTLELPTGATATGLRVKQGTRWQAATLLPVDAASERYALLTDDESPASAPPGTPALL